MFSEKHLATQVRDDHLSLCLGYVDLLQGKDIDNDEELVEFFSLVMAMMEGWN